MVWYPEDANFRERLEWVFTFKPATTDSILHSQFPNTGKHNKLWRWELVEPSFGNPLLRYSATPFLSTLPTIKERKDYN